jgi:hypothetical protein
VTATGTRAAISATAEQPVDIDGVAATLSSTAPSTPAVIATAAEEPS